MESGIPIPPPGSRDRAFATVVVCSSIVAIGIAAVYWLSRAGFANPRGPILRTTGFSLFLICAPCIARRAIARWSGASSWISSYSCLWLATLLLTGIAGRIGGPGSGIISTLLGAAGAVAFAIILAGWLRGSGIRRSSAVIAGSAVFAVWISGVVWGRIYKNPLFFENLSANGMVHHDSLHLAAFANMLRTYGAASTGLDGLPYIPYHWGTAWLFAQWSNLLGVGVLDFYQLAFPVLMIPFFFGGILAAATEIGSRERLVDLGTGGRPWLILLAASVGVIPIAAMDAMGVWTSNVVISESYTVAVPAALLLLATTVVFWRKRGSSRVADAIFVLAVLPLGIVALGYLKISLMVLAFILALYAGVRLGLYRDRIFLVAGILLAGLVILTYTRVSLPAHNEGLSPLDFLSDFVPRAWWPFFFVVHLFWSWAYVLLRAWQSGARTFGELLVVLRERRLLDAEAVALIAIAGVTPGLIIHIDGGSAFYFSDVQRWLSVTLLIAWAGTRAGRPNADSAATAVRQPLRKTPAVRFLIAFVAIPMGISMVLNASRWPLQMIRENAATRRGLYAASGAPPVHPGIRALPGLASSGVLQPALRGAWRFAALDQLRALNDLPLRDRRRTALFIPQSEAFYWGILARPGACTFAPFVAPAIAGMAMIDGMPGVGCELSRYYGIGSYAPRLRAQTAADAEPAVLCARAGRYGLDRVLIIGFVDDGVMTRQAIECRRLGTDVRGLQSRRLRLLSAVSNTSSPACQPFHKCVHQTGALHALPSRSFKLTS